MNDLNKLADYRAAIAAVRRPNLDSPRLRGYMKGAITAALNTIDNALEMRGPALTAAPLSEREARDRGMIPVTIAMELDHPFLRSVCRDMRRGDTEHAIVRETAAEGFVSVWRIPA